MVTDTTASFFPEATANETGRTNHNAPILIQALLLPLQRKKRQYKKNKTCPKSQLWDKQAEFPNEFGE